MGVALLAGPANVIMQLGQPGRRLRRRGRGRVDSGRTDPHPIKRARTTFTYLAVATRGSDAQKGGPTGARSTRPTRRCIPPRTSSVKYNAFDKNLQLWVAACLYKGGVEACSGMFIGELDDETADRHYRESVTMGTTLQVPEDRPADRRRVRPVLGGIAGAAAHRRHRAWLPVSDRGGPTQESEAAPRGAAPTRRGGTTDHHGLSSAAVPRRDAAAVGMPRVRSGSTG